MCNPLYLTYSGLSQTFTGIDMLLVVDGKTVSDTQEAINNYLLVSRKRYLKTNYNFLMMPVAGKREFIINRNC